MPFGRAVAAGTHRRVVFVISAQSGKTETIFDIIGQRMDQAPAPILYVGPNKQFLNEQLEPRIVELLDTPTLRRKRAGAKRMTKTRKLISGVPLRLAHSGSTTALKSDPAALAITDEADELMASVRGQGDPIGLVDARGDTHKDFVHAIVSTPSVGPSEVERDPVSGLEFWAQQEPTDVHSKVWTLWQSGTRYHWAWPCPHCNEYFVPRFSCLAVPGKDWTRVSPSEAKAKSAVICPRNGCIIDDDAEGRTKAEMNRRGVYVAPGQTIDEDGNVCGEPPQSATISFWVSGLCSPFVNWGERALRYVEALRSGDNASIQTVINAGFGELWAPRGGEAPEWEEVQKCCVPLIQRRTLPPGVVFITAGVDVQKNRLPYVIRGWGARSESWLLDSGELWGETELDGVWADLANLLEQPIEGMHIRRAFVDAGFRPGKMDMVPEHKVYEFARRNARIVRASKGFDRRDTPLSVKRIEVTDKGKQAKFGLELVRLDTDFFKSWVHSRIRWPDDQPGGWHLFAPQSADYPDGVTEDYCRQIVSESRVRKPSGGFSWVQLSRNNHMLDCEALAYAAAYMTGVQRIPDGMVMPPRPALVTPAQPRTEPQPQRAAANAPPKRTANWLGPKRQGWL